MKFCTHHTQARRYSVLLLGWRWSPVRNSAPSTNVLKARATVSQNAPLPGVLRMVQARRQLRAAHEIPGVQPVVGQEQQVHRDERVQGHAEPNPVIARRRIGFRRAGRRAGP